MALLLYSRPAHIMISSSMEITLLACLHASSVNMFKNKIDKYLAKAGYT